MADIRSLGKNAAGLALVFLRSFVGTLLVLFGLPTAVFAQTYVLLALLNAK